MNMCDAEQFTPLIWATTNGRTLCVKMLLEGGANVSQASKNGTTALMDATARGNYDCVSLLISTGADLNAFDKRGYSALMLAAHHQQISLSIAAERRLTEKLSSEHWHCHLP